MKKLLTLLFLCACSTVAFAQATPTSGMANGLEGSGGGAVSSGSTTTTSSGDVATDAGKTAVKKVKDKITNKSAKDSTLTDTSYVYEYPDEDPEYPGGVDAMNKFLSDNIKYPQAEKDSSKQGTVYVGFIIERDGSLSNIHMVKSVPGAPGFDAEALRVVGMMPKWKTGKMQGKNVRSEYTLPIRFALQ